MKELKTILYHGNFGLYWGNKCYWFTIVVSSHTRLFEQFMSDYNVPSADVQKRSKIKKLNINTKFCVFKLVYC